MNFFLVLGSVLWSRFLNYSAYLLVRDVSYPLYNPRSFTSIGIEVASIFTFLYSFTIFPFVYIPALWFFFSALFITMHTDAQTMLISRYVTIYLVPFGWFFASFGFLPISSLESILGSCLGLLLLWVTAKISLVVMKTEGLGQGDIDLLCFIGSFIGPIGCWMALLLGSFSGAMSGLIYMVISRKRENLRLPFGVFLCGGAIIFLLFKDTLLKFFLFT